MLWEKMTSNEFDQAIDDSKGLCVMPIGCLERHGQHLAVGCDSIKAAKICEFAAEKEPCVVFPTGYWLGDLITYHSLDIEKEHKRGGFALKPETLFSILSELCDEIGRNGFRKILIVSSHGGNSSVLNYLLRSKFYEKHDYAVLSTTASSDRQLEAANLLKIYQNDPDRFTYITPEDIKVLEHFAPISFGGGHADFRETALCMAIDKKGLVREDKYEAESGISNHCMDFLGENEISCGAAWGANYPNAYNAFAPVGCSETLSQMIMDLSVERLAHIFKVIKNDEKTVKLAQRLPLDD